MTLLTAGSLTDPQLPATASNVCTTDAKLGGVSGCPLNKNLSYAGALSVTVMNAMRRKCLFNVLQCPVFRMDVQRSPEQGPRRASFPELARELPSVDPVLVASDGPARPTCPPARDRLRPGGARARPLQRPLRSRTHSRRRHGDVDQDWSLLWSP